MKKTLSLIILAIILAFTMTACSEPVKIDPTVPDQSTSNTQDFPVELNGVTINSKPVKVVVLSGSIADVVLALNYEETLIAVSSDCTQSDLSTLPVVDSNDAQAILNLGADLVLGRNLSEGFVSTLKEQNIPAIDVSAATDRNDFERLYTHIATAMNGASTGYSKGSSTAKNIFTTLDDLSRIIPKQDTITMGVYITDTNGGALMGNTIGDTVMSYAGLTNAFTGSTDATFNFDELKIFDPSFIFCNEGLKDLILSDSRYSNLSAIKNGKVYEFPASYSAWEGRTIITLATEIAGIVYPELLEENVSENKIPDIDSKADENDIPDVSITVEDLDNMNTKNYETLNLEDENDDVYTMQERLSELGYLTVTYNGFFGNTTKDSLEAFEEKNSLTVDGIADNATLQALFSRDALGFDDEIETDTSSSDESSKSEDDE